MNVMQIAQFAMSVGEKGHRKVDCPKRLHCMVCFKNTHDTFACPQSWQSEDTQKKAADEAINQTSSSNLTSEKIANETEDGAVGGISNTMPKIDNKTSSPNFTPSQKETLKTRAQKENIFEILEGELASQASSSLLHPPRTLSPIQSQDSSEFVVGETDEENLSSKMLESTTSTLDDVSNELEEQSKRSQNSNPKQNDDSQNSQKSILKTSQKKIYVSSFEIKGKRPRELDSSSESQKGAPPKKGIT